MTKTEISNVTSAAHALSALQAFSGTLAPRRYDNLFEHEAARQWIESQLRDAGLQVTLLNFTGKNAKGNGIASPGQDILATLPGPVNSSSLVMGAHYDGSEGGYGAAYDDGSGVVVVIELARALAKTHPHHNFVFAFWDQEEDGLLGSAAYAQHVLNSNHDIAAYVNFDMIGLNWPAKFAGTNPISIKIRLGGPNQDAEAQIITNVTTLLGLPKEAFFLEKDVKADGSSDHAAFLATGVSIIAFSALDSATSYPQYHNADTYDAMVADSGNKPTDVQAGFQTALDLGYGTMLLLDR